MINAQLDHVAIAVRDIRASMRLYCDVLGATFLFAGDQHEDVPMFGISVDQDQWKEVFIHPRDAHGVLLQIAQSAWTDEEVAGTI